VLQLPPHLLKLPHQPVDDFPDLPYDQPGARETMLKAAKRASFRLEGTLDVKPHDVTVMVQLHDTNGPVGKAASGTHRLPKIAASLAVEALARSHDVPLQGRYNALRRTEFHGCREGACGLKYERLRWAIILAEGAPDAAACKALGELNPLGLTLLLEPTATSAGCRVSLAHAGIPVPDPAAFVDSQPEPGRTVLRALMPRADPKEALRTLQPLAEKAEGVALAQLKHPMVLAQLRLGQRDEASTTLATIVADHPDVCWGRLVVLSHHRGQPGYAARQKAVAAWCPQQPLVWVLGGALTKSPADRLALQQVGFVLAGRHASLALGIMEKLTVLDRPQALGLLAARFKASKHRGHRFTGALISAFRDYGYARPARATNTMRTALLKVDRMGQDALPMSLRWSLDLLRFSDELTGTGSDAIDAVLKGVVLATPPRTDWAGDDGWALGMAALTLHASRDVALPALARIRKQLLDPARAPGTMRLPRTEVTQFLDGLKLAIEGNATGAAKSWRTLVQNGGWHGWLDPATFDAAGEPELGSRIDAPRITFAGRIISARHYREAKRAAARGDHEQARKLATMFVDHYGAADVPIPGVKEMRALVAKRASPPREPPTQP